ncbi:hypothetical protein ZIOFF_018424 [Zingiber officinale]|uniref:Uncharacterized protein n=1 Tax=Zingiber officinale TaxID=94328 RepID=A0A8J5LM37_ZINOF|nr:hypothetical protein ZIOFF_018424 [Zingiber officinale]
MADTAKVFNMPLAMMCGIKAEKEISRDGIYYSLSIGILPSLGARSNRRVKLRRFIVSPYDRRYRTDSEGLQQQETLDALPKAIRSNITHYLFYSPVQSVYLFHGVSNDLLFQLRGIHSRNKKAMELVAKGWSALQEVDRVIDYADRNDTRLILQLRVETRTLEELEELLEFSSQNRTSLTRIMLDNMVVPLPNGDVDVSMQKDAVQLVNGRFETEFTNLKYSRVEIDEVRFEWIECMLDYI